jgi:hypothetical protein
MSAQRTQSSWPLPSSFSKKRAKSESLTKSDFTSEDRQRTGRGHKGIYQKVAERQRVDQAAVRKRAAKVAERIGEPVDLDRDPPAELERKAAKFKATAKPAREIRTPKRDGEGDYVLRTGARSAGPNLIEALGHVVAFTPASARKWIADHPDETKKARSLAASAVKVIKAIEVAKEPRERFEEAVAAFKAVLQADGPDAVIQAAKDALGEDVVADELG